ncbi:MAG: TRAP transporter large permease subunit [Deltaproteobacteria bacterium]|nr:TRAP transporter large permease subunit [Deltaproteobacteria bacterium]
MALMAVTEILGRKLGVGGISGAQEYVQHLTMWAGFLGALLATREGKHLGLSLAELLPRGPVRSGAHFFAGTVAALVSAMLAVAAAGLVDALRGSGSQLGGGITEWVSVAVMPVTLAIIALRQAVASSSRWSLRGVALALVVGCFLGRLIMGDPDAAEPSWVIRTVNAFQSRAGTLQWPLSLAILVALLLGTPVYAAMSGLAMVWFFAADTPIASVPTETYRLVASPTLPAIPILTAAGFVLATGGSSARLVRLFRSLVGFLPGGMALMVIAVCAIFTTLTGGSGVTILALGGLVYPILRQEKYPENFSLGLVTASGSLGLLFFPSVPVILYAVVSQQPVENLFIAGLLPGVVMILMVAAWAVFVGVRTGTSRHPFSFKEVGAAVAGAKWDLGAPLIVLVSFASGWATMVEAAALAFIYSVIMEVFICRTLTLRQGLPRALVEGGTLVGSVLMVLGMAMGLTSYMVDEGIPEIVIQWVQQHISSQFVFLLILNALLLVLGSVLEIFSAIVILAPLLAPLGRAYGIDPLHLGIIFLANLELGFLFPPVGLNLFLSSTRFGKPLPQMYRAAFPFLVIMSLSVLVITYVPWMSTGVFRAWEARNKPAVTAPAAPAPADAPALDPAAP